MLVLMEQCTRDSGMVKESLCLHLYLAFDVNALCCTLENSFLCDEL